MRGGAGEGAVEFFLTSEVKVAGSGPGTFQPAYALLNAVLCLAISVAAALASVIESFMAAALTWLARNGMSPLVLFAISARLPLLISRNFW